MLPSQGKPISLTFFYRHHQPCAAVPIPGGRFVLHLMNNSDAPVRATVRVDGVPVGYVVLMPDGGFGALAGAFDEHGDFRSLVFAPPRQAVNAHDRVPEATVHEVGSIIIEWCETRKLDTVTTQHRAGTLLCQANSKDVARASELTGFPVGTTALGPVLTSADKVAPQVDWEVGPVVCVTSIRYMPVEELRAVVAEGGAAAGASHNKREREGEGGAVKRKKTMHPA